MSVVSSLNTGRRGFSVTFSRTSPVWSYAVTWDDISTPARWTQSRISALYLAALELGETDHVASEMAKVAAIVWANESGWGRHEYRWNGWGCHPFPGADKMLFTEGDPELAAFANIRASVLKFWSVVLSDSSIAQRFRAGDNTAVVSLYQTDFGDGATFPQSDVDSIATRIATYLGSEGVSAPVSRGSSGSGAKWLVALAAVVALASAGRDRT